MLLYIPALYWVALLSIFSLNVKAKPQDISVFEDLAKSGLLAMGTIAETISNDALISKNAGFELPFAKANSETQIGAGGAMRNNDDDDDDSSEEIRRKRALNLDENAPCHGGGTGAGGGTGSTGGIGGGTGSTGGIGGGTGDLDVQEARRRAAYNRAKRAKKIRKNTRSGKKKYFSLNAEEESKMQQLLSQRRKRQTEADDLNANMKDASNGLAQQAQQFAEKVSNIFQGFMNSMNEMAQRLKQQFSGGGAAPENNAEV